MSGVALRLDELGAGDSFQSPAIFPSGYRLRPSLSIDMKGRGREPSVTLAPAFDRHRFPFAIDLHQE